MGAIVVVLLSPGLNNTPGIRQRVEQITIYALPSELTDKPLNIRIFPRTARRDVYRLITLLCQPAL